MVKVFDTDNDLAIRARPQSPEERKLYRANENPSQHEHAAMGYETLACVPQEMPGVKERRVTYNEEDEAECLTIFRIR